MAGDMPKGWEGVGRERHCSNETTGLHLKPQAFFDNETGTVTLNTDPPIAVHIAQGYGFSRYCQEFKT